MLDLDDDIVIKLSIERMEDVVCCPGPVIFEISPVEVVVIDECPIKQDPAVRLKGACQHVRSIGWCSAVGRRSEAAFGVGLHCKTAEIRNMAVDLFNSFFPPLRDFWVRRIERSHSSDLLRTAQVKRDRQPDAPRPECIGDSG
jgi:hypothetical protein